MVRFSYFQFQWFQWFQWLRDFSSIFLFSLIVNMPRVLQNRLVMSLIFSTGCSLDSLSVCIVLCCRFERTRSIYKNVFCSIVHWILSMFFLFTTISIPITIVCWLFVLINIVCVFSVVNPKNIYTSDNTNFYEQSV